MVTELEATPGQLAELKLLVPKVSTLINEFQMVSIASSLDFELAPGLRVRDYLSEIVANDSVSEDALVEIVRTIRIALLRPSWKAAADQQIAVHGYTIQPVSGSEDQPSLAYTVGLTGTVGFEIMALAGHDSNLVTHVVGSYAELAKLGENIQIERNDIIELVSGLGCRTKCIPVEALVATQDFLTDRRGDVKVVYQVLIADKNNCLPDESGYDKSFRQPYLPRPLVQ